MENRIWSHLARGLVLSLIPVSFRASIFSCVKQKEWQSISHSYVTLKQDEGCQNFICSFLALSNINQRYARQRVRCWEYKGDSLQEFSSWF